MPSDGIHKPAAPWRNKPAPKTTVYATTAAAVAELERQHGPRSALWTYHNAEGEPVGMVIRWDTPTGKTFRPVSRRGTGWVIGGMSRPRPLYQLPTLADARRVCICEGEKAADSLRSIGLIATTSVHGSGSAKETDWSPPAGKEVGIFPDNDDAGRQYANEVAAILLELDPPPTVKLIDLPNLPEGGDAVEFISARRSAGLDDDAIRAEIEELVGAAEVVENNVKRVNSSVRRARMVHMSEVKPRPLEWLWPGRIPLGKLTLIPGDPGLGKTFVTIDMSARVSRGAP